MPTSQLYITPSTSITTNRVTDIASTAARIAGVTGMHSHDDVQFVGMNGVPAQVAFRNLNSLSSTSATITRPVVTGTQDDKT